MQDFDLRAADGDAVNISSLLIESPGENTIKNNSDHFIKRDHVRLMCPHCAGLACSPCRRMRRRAERAIAQA